MTLPLFFTFTYIQERWFTPNLTKSLTLVLLFTLLSTVFQTWHPYNVPSWTADAEIKVPSIETQEHSNVLPGVHQNIATHALPAPRFLSLAGADTSIILSWQKYVCHDKGFVMASILLPPMFVTTKVLSWQNWYLWQLPPMIEFFLCGPVLFFF